MTGWSGTGVPARPTSVAIVDYGAGNLVSIGQALARVGADVRLARTGADLDSADALVVPGVGAAAPAMARLRRRGLLGPILDWVTAGRPYLGICLGLQLLFEGSDEDGARTFGVLAGRTVVLEGAPSLPHIGWNQVSPCRTHPLFDRIAPGANFYFVHSYVGQPARDSEDVVVARTTHGAAFASVVARGPLLGVQFHPERSDVDGLRLLANFVGLARSA